MLGQVFRTPAHRGNSSMRSALFAAAAALLVAAVPLLARADAAPKIPPVASLTDGMWMKGDLHLHSRHSKESSNNPESKIITFSKSVGMDYICITDHDNHVDGDV